MSLQSPFTVRLRREFRDCHLLRLSIYSLKLPVGAGFAHVLRHCFSGVIMRFGSRECQGFDPDDLLKSIDNQKTDLAIS